MDKLMMKLSFRHSEDVVVLRMNEKMLVVCHAGL